MVAHKLLARDEILDNELRARIMDYLQKKPGAYLGNIGRDLDIPTSTLKYHLNILSAFEFVSAVKKGRCRHYFPKKQRMSDLEKKMYAAIEHGPTRRIVDIVRTHPGISQGGLVKETGLSQSTVAWHMAKLEEMNLIRSHRDGVKEYFLRADFEQILERTAQGLPPVTLEELGLADAGRPAEAPGAASGPERSDAPRARPFSFDAVEGEERADETTTEAHL